MEQRTSVRSSIPNPEQLHMYGSSSQTQHLAGNGFFLGTGPADCPPQIQNPAHKSESGSACAYSTDLNSYLESFPLSDYSSNQVLTFGPMFGMGHQLEAPRGMSSEALLDAISLAQRKLQHLEVIVRMMVQGTGHQGMTQQHQSLSLEFTSIMSQLFAATSIFSSPQSFQTSSPLPPHSTDTFDFGFDGFNEDELNNNLRDGTFCPPASSMDAINSGICEGLRTLDERSAEVGPITTSNEAANIVTVQGSMAENNVVKGAQNEAGKTYVTHESENQMLISSEDHREEDDDGEGESLPPGSYELVELAATEILAEHTHFCEICSKGFKRDANLRMHMRGHGDEYKTAAALARPDKMPRDTSLMKLRRYSCPYAGCKRNKKHQKFLPLKTMLCVKNHYRRSHCPKLLVCSRCKEKKFSVVADLKTHEKHCGQDKWQCSCGTTFSRKDKLHGHLVLFAGHTPATPAAHEVEGLGGFRDGLEGLAGSNTSASGIAGLSASAMQENLAAKYVDVSQGLSTFDMPVIVGTRTNENDGGSFNEKGMNQREKSTLLSFSKGALSDSSFPSSTAGMGSEGSELRNLPLNGLFHQARGSN